MEELKESGTYRPSRHGDRPGAEPTPNPVSAAQVPPPGNLGPSGQALWHSILSSGCIGEHDIPLLLEAFEWYTTYRDALAHLQQDVTNSRARMASNTAYQNFVTTLKQIGVTPAMLKKGKPVEPVSPMELHCQRLESMGMGGLADELRHCRYDFMRWLRWRRGLVDDQGNEILREQVLANEYDEAVQNGWDGRVRCMESDSEFDTYKHLVSGLGQ